MNEFDASYIIFISFIIVMLFLVLYHIYTMPPNPIYISSKLFPIIVNTSYNTSYISTNKNSYNVYIFNGIKQANGTECISNVQISRYVFNYTIQRYQIAWNETITDPTQVYNAYNKVKYIFPIISPSGYAPLCPNIVNATS